MMSTSCNRGLDLCGCNLLEALAVLCSTSQARLLHRLWRRHFGKQLEVLLLRLSISMKLSDEGWAQSPTVKIKHLVVGTSYRVLVELWQSVFESVFCFCFCHSSCKPCIYIKRLTPERPSRERFLMRIFTFENARHK